MAGDFSHGRCCIPGAGNTKASADAVAKLATALKAKFGEEREDKFSEASKVVKHPEIIHPTQKAGLAFDLQELVDLRPARV